MKSRKEKKKCLKCYARDLKPFSSNTGKMLTNLSRKMMCQILFWKASPGSDLEFGLSGEEMGGRESDWHLLQKSM